MKKKKTVPLIFSLVLLLTACDNMFLTQPFKIEGDMDLFLDGQLILSGYIDWPFDEDLGNYGFYLKSDDNSLDVMDELMILQRWIGWSEIWATLENPGVFSMGWDDLSGYYQFESSLACSYYGAGINDGAVTSGSLAGYSAGLGTTGINLGSGCTVRLGDYVLPGKLGEFSAAFFFYDPEFAQDETVLFQIADPDDSKARSITVCTDDQGRIKVEGMKNWTGLWYQLEDDFDRSSWHHFAIRIRN